MHLVQGQEKFQNQLNEFGNFIIQRVKAAYDWQLNQFPMWLLEQLTSEQLSFFGDLKKMLSEDGAHRWLSTMLTITGRFKWDPTMEFVVLIPNIKPIFEGHGTRIRDDKHLRSPTLNEQEADNNPG